MDTAKQPMHYIEATVNGEAHTYVFCDVHVGSEVSGKPDTGTTIYENTKFGGWKNYNYCDHCGAEASGIPANHNPRQGAVEFEVTA